jgi:uncharacterized membrane protein YkoI
MSRRYSPVLGAGLALAAAVASAQTTPPAQPAVKITGSTALKARAKVSGDSAARIALAQVPNGSLRSGEIEREKGKLIYSFDLAVAGKPGIEEVHVDAITGAVVAREHETAAQERKENKPAATAKPSTPKKP